MTKDAKLESGLVGVAGEYYVAAELSARGYLAAITLRNSQGIDIIASSKDGSRSVSLQVKTSTGKRPVWILNKKSEDFASANHFYAMVLLKDVGKTERPDFYIIPSSTIASRIAAKHRTWLRRKKKDGSPRKDSAMRKFSDEDGEFKEAWELLGLSI